MVRIPSFPRRSSSGGTAVDDRGREVGTDPAKRPATDTGAIRAGEQIDDRNEYLGRRAAGTATVPERVDTSPHGEKRVTEPAATGRTAAPVTDGPAGTERTAAERTAAERTAARAADRADANRSAELTAERTEAERTADRREMARDRTGTDGTGPDRTGTDRTAPERPQGRPATEPIVVRAPAPKARASVLATLGLVTGVSAALLVLTGELAAYGIALAVLGLLLSLGGISATSRRHVAGKSDALLGVILSVGAMVLGGLALTGALSWLTTETDTVGQIKQWLDTQFANRF